jgi:molecular chaperone GrpE
MVDLMKEKREKAQASHAPGDGKSANAAEQPVAAPSQLPQAPSVPKEEYDALVETLQRLQAEFENYKKRVARESAELSDQANAELLRQLLPVLDNLELALSHVKPEERQEGLYKGVELIHAQLLDLLEANGVKAIQPAEGDRFDPHRHEAMLAEQRDGAEKHTVLEVLQKGHLLKERVLRAAKVKVTK